MKRAIAVVFLAAGLLAALLQPAGAAGKSKNVRPVARVAYKGGSHLAFGGGYAYGGEINGVSGRDQAGYEDKGGIHVFDITGRIRETGFFHCPGNDLDVAYIRRGLIAVGYHKAACAPGGEGVMTLGISKSGRPRKLGHVTLEYPFQRNHAIARYPGKPLVYAVGGGLGARQETVTMVDVSNPRKPKVAGSFVAPPRGCHDFSFHFDKRGKFGFCFGLQDTQIWDVSKPLKPEVITHIPNPLIQFSHYGVVSKDGKLLVINDEAIAANECGDADAPAGAIWVYNISDIENPKLLSYYSPPRGDTGSPIGSFWTPGGTCTSHDFNFVDNRTVVVPWYTGGFNVLSLKNPSEPKEIAYYQPKGTNMWSAHWYRGKIYTNDMGRGFEAVEVSGL